MIFSNSNRTNIFDKWMCLFQRLQHQASVEMEVKEIKAYSIFIKSS